MALSDIRAEIKSILEGVTDIGKVFSYDRWTTNWEHMLKLFETDGVIKGFQFSRVRSSEVNSTTSQNVRTHVFVIQGIHFYSDKTATEKTFDNLIESIATAFRDKPDLNGKASSCSPLQVDMVGSQMHGTKFAHKCELRLEVEEDIQWR